MRLCGGRGDRGVGVWRYVWLGEWVAAWLRLSLSLSLSLFSIPSLTDLSLSLLTLSPPHPSQIGVSMVPPSLPDHLCSGHNGLHYPRPHIHWNRVPPALPSRQHHGAGRDSGVLWDILRCDGKGLRGTVCGLCSSICYSEWGGQKRGMGGNEGVGNRGVGEWGSRGMGE